MGCTLAFDFRVPSVVAVQVAAARFGLLDERLDVVWGHSSEPVAVTEVVTPTLTRVHVVDAPAGPVTLSYTASTATPSGPVDVVPPSALHDDPVVTALRQSRYCPSDLLLSFAMTELGAFAGSEKLAEAAASWVFERIAYQVGSSGPGDTAVETLLSGRGVCRDFAHLTITLCRAMGVPARLVSVYAPGLFPLDFHAVVEVWRDGRWDVIDPTRLAPRSSLVRIATGRDAADTAFVTTLRGEVDLVYNDVFAIVEGDLPDDDHVGVVTLPAGSV